MIIHNIVVTDRNSAYVGVIPMGDRGVVDAYMVKLREDYPHYRFQRASGNLDQDHLFQSTFQQFMLGRAALGPVGAYIKPAIGAPNQLTVLVDKFKALIKGVKTEAIKCVEQNDGKPEMIETLNELYDGIELGIEDLPIEEEAA